MQRGNALLETSKLARKRCERAYDCNQPLTSDYVKLGHDWSRLHATVIGSHLLV